MIEQMYIDALLSAAAYAKWDKSESEIKEELIKERGFTEKQYKTLFVGDGTTDPIFEVYQTPSVGYTSTSNGFSATIFKNRQTGKLTVSFRGTEPGPRDFATDFLLALGIGSIEELFGNGQLSEIELFFINAGLADADGNILVDENSIDFVGHSLGGHMATMAAYKYPDMVKSVHTYNGAGLKGWDEIWNTYIAGSVSGGTLDPNRVTNYYADKGIELTADQGLWFNRPGGRQEIFIEYEGLIDDLTFTNHGINKLVESLSVYRVLATLDSKLDNSDGLKAIYSILDASSNDSEQSLENMVVKLGALLGGDFPANTGDIELFYQLLFNEGVLKPEYQNLTIKSSSVAQDDIGYRYALLHLDPFTITGFDYTQHNNNDELNLYDSSTGKGMTEAYLQARAEMLRWKMAFDTEDLDYEDDDYDADYIQGNWDYIDKTTGIELVIDGNDITFSDHQVVFGSSASDLLMGSGDTDQLFGGGDNDELYGKDDDDYMEGNDGNDLLDGGDGNDTMLGGMGNDKFKGRAGNDYLEGGKGDDTYIYEEGDGFDTIFDVDGTGSIVFDTTTLNGGDKIGDGLYQSSDGKYTYAFNGAANGIGNLIINGVIHVENFRSGTLGITLGDYQPEEPPETATEIIGTTGDDIPGNQSGPLDGDDASDHIMGLAGNDIIDGHNNDDMLEGGLGSDIVIGGYGVDVLHAGDASDVAKVIDSDTQPVGDTHDWLAGGADNDFLYGSDGADALVGGRGKDYVYGGAGDDYILGDSEEVPQDHSWIDTWISTGVVEANGTRNPVGSDNDVLMGGAGNDQIWGQAGDDTISGGIGNDSLSGDMVGGGGSDLSGEFHGNDILYGGKGNDGITGDGGDDLLVGGDGDDHLHGDFWSVILEGEGLLLPEEFHGVDILYGNDGDDFMVGGAKDDTLYGGDGDDKLYGDDDTTGVSQEHHGDDYLDGGAGNDILAGNSGSDTLIGGDGDDDLFGDSSGADESYHGNDTLLGGEGSDILYGKGGNDTLDGGTGDNSLYGGNGDDVLYSGAGNDYLSGGAGADTFTFYSGGSVDTIGDGDAEDTVSIHTTNEISASIHGNNEYLKLKYGIADVLYIKGGTATKINKFELGDGQTLTRDELLNMALTEDIDIQLEEAGEASGGSGNDTLMGSSGDDVLFGLDGDDYLYGGDGDDVLYSGEGNDHVFGGAGNDTIYSGGGLDELEGGFGNDIYCINLDNISYSSVTILDNEGSNSLVVGSSISSYFPTLSYGSLKITFENSQLEVHLDSFDPNDVLGGPRDIDTFIFSDITYTYEELVALGFDLNGTSDDDIIDGTSVVDRITGLGGDDVLRGGTGDDQYLFHQGDGVDVIRDDEGANLIQLLDVELGDITTSSMTDTEGNTYLVIKYSTTDAVHVMNGLSHTGDVYELSDGVFSADELISHTWDDINHAPVVDMPLSDLKVTEDIAFIFQIPEGTFSDQDDGDVLSLSAELSDGSALPVWLSFDATTSTLSGTPDNSHVGLLDISIKATDSYGETVFDTFTLEIDNVNDAPELMNALSDVEAVEGDSFSYIVPTDTFLDIDQGDSLTYTASLANGESLPSWISFDPVTLTLSSDLPMDAAGEYDITIQATDQSGISVSDIFHLSVTNLIQNPTWWNCYHGTSLNDLIVGSDNDEWLMGYGGNDQLHGGAGRDHLYGGSGDDVLVGDDGSDRYHSSYINRFGRFGGGLFGYRSNNDMLAGGDGNDLLQGGAGNDRLYGEKGDDVLEGGSGNDLLNGGTGSDTYIFSLNDGQDIIDNYDANSDDLDIISFEGIANNDLWFSRNRRDLVIDVVGSNDSVTVKNWYRGDNYQIDTIEVGDLALQNDQINQLVNAMAQFDVPVGAGTVATQERRDQYESVLAASW